MFQSCAKPMRKNCSLQANSKNPVSDDLADSNNHEDSYSRTEDEAIKSGHLNKRNLKSYQKKLLTARLKKLECQTTDNVHKRSNLRTGTRMANDEENSWVSVDEEQNSEDGREEDESMRAEAFN